jgi:hypothetical protein
MASGGVVHGVDGIIYIVVVSNTRGIILSDVDFE